MFKIIRTIGDITRTIQIDSNNHFKEFGLNNNVFEVKKAERGIINATPEYLRNQIRILKQDK